MKIILLREVKNLGRKGEAKEVAAGYARNFLLPKKLAIMATKGSIKLAEVMREKEESRKQQVQVSLKNIKKSFEGKTVAIKAKANEEGHLFAGIGARDISETLDRELKVKVDPLMIKLDKKIKSVGEYKVEVKAGGETVGVKVMVVGE